MTLLDVDNDILLDVDNDILFDVDNDILFDVDDTETNNNPTIKTQNHQ